MIVVVVIILIVLVLAGIVPFLILVVVMLGDAFEMWLELPMALLRGKRADLHVDVTSGHFGLLIALAHGFEVFLDLSGEQVAEFLVSHLTATELELDAHFVTFGEEVFGVGDLDEVIVRIDADTELHLLHLASLLMLVGLFLVLFLDVFELAVVDDFAHRRVSHRGNFDEVQTTFFSRTESHMRGHDAQLMLTVFFNDAHLGGTDALVDAVQFIGMASTVAISTPRAISTTATTAAKRAWSLPWRARACRASCKAIGGGTCACAQGARSNTTNGWARLGRTWLGLLRARRIAAKLPATQALEWIANG